MTGFEIGEFPATDSVDKKIVGLLIQRFGSAAEFSAELFQLTDIHERTISRLANRTHDLDHGTLHDKQVGCHYGGFCCDGQRTGLPSDNPVLYLATMEARAEHGHYSERCEKYDVVPKWKLFPQGVVHGSEDDKQYASESIDCAGILVGDPRG
jgi:hypothetical protein